jgi:hypothetical protein
VTWIRVDAALCDRKVVGRLKNVLKLSAGLSAGRPAPCPQMSDVNFDKLLHAAAAGHLQMLWGRVALYCKHGRVADVSDEQLETWAGWWGEPGAFASFVRTQHTNHGAINDWDDMNGKLDDRREADKARKRQKRADEKAKAKVAPAPPASRVREMSAGHPHSTVRNVTSLPATPSRRAASSNGQVTLLLPVMPVVPHEQNGKHAENGRLAPKSKGNGDRAAERKYRGPRPPGGWPHYLARPWEEHIGPVSGGEFAGQLAKVVNDYPLPILRRAIQCYVTSCRSTGAIAKPAWFVQEIKRWVAEIDQLAFDAPEYAQDDCGYSDEAKQAARDGRMARLTADAAQEMAGWEAP